VCNAAPGGPFLKATPLFGLKRGKAMLDKVNRDEISKLLIADIHRARVVYDADKTSSANVEVYIGALKKF
jgi:hypothetical protein